MTAKSKGRQKIVGLMAVIIAAVLLLAGPAGADEKKKPVKDVPVKVSLEVSNEGAELNQVALVVKFDKDIYDCDKHLCAGGTNYISHDYLPFSTEGYSGSWMMSWQSPSSLMLLMDANLISNTLTLTWRDKFGTSYDPQTRYVINAVTDVTIDGTEKIVKKTGWEKRGPVARLITKPQSKAQNFKTVLGFDTLYPKQISQHSYRDYLEIEFDFSQEILLDDLQQHVKYFNKSTEAYEFLPKANLRVEKINRKDPDDRGKIFSVQIFNDDSREVKVKLLAGLKATGIAQPLSRDIETEMPSQNFMQVSETRTGFDRQYPWQPFIQLDFKDYLLEGNLKEFIKLEPNQPYELISKEWGEGTRLTIKGDFVLDKEYTVTLKKGLKGDRTKLENDYTIEYAPSLENVSPQIIFARDGRYLSPNRALVLRIGSRNVESVRLQAWELPEFNLPAIVNIQKYEEEFRNQVTWQFSKNFFDQMTKIEGKQNQVHENLIDLNDVLAKPNQPGCYLFKITPQRQDSPAEEYYDEYYYDSSDYDYRDYYQNSKRYLPVIITDLGISAHKNGGNLLVWINSLSSAGPVGEAQIKVYNQANEVIAQGVTDKDGLINLDISHDTAVFFTAKKGDDLSYLVIGQQSGREGYYDGYYYEDDDYESSYYGEAYESWEKRAKRWYGAGQASLNLRLPEVAATKDYLTQGYEGFVFLPRDLYKPGETVKIKAIIRDTSLKAPDKSFPVVWQIYDPTGNVFGQGQQTISPLGGLDFEIEVPHSARTGQYRAEIKLPASSQTMGRAYFQVEDFMPPRLSLTSQFTKADFVGADEAFEADLSVKYLFGALGSNLPYEADFIMEEYSYAARGWEGFNFNSSDVEFERIQSVNAVTDALDDKGQALVSFQVPEHNRLPDALRVSFLIRVQEDGGRWDSKKISANYFPNPVIIGVKYPDEFKVASAAKLEVGAIIPGVSPEKQIEGGLPESLDFSIYKIKNFSYWEYRNSRSRVRTVDESLLAHSGRVFLKDGRADLTFTPEEAGDYMMVVKDPFSGHYKQQRFTVYGPGYAADRQVEGLALSLDKEKYVTGDTAVLSVAAPYAGALLVTVDTNKNVFSQTVIMDSDKAQISIPVTGEFLANAYITATVIRPLTAGETAPSQTRAIGVMPIYIDKAPDTVNIEAVVPDKIRPSTQMPLKLKLTDGQGRPAAGEVTVFLVDEGILSLTNFKTPDPVAAFWSARRFTQNFFDLYDLLLPVETGDAPFLKPGGGDEEAQEGLFSPFNRKQVLLSIFVATIDTNKDGEAETVLDLPEYSGQGRLMIIANAGDKLGSKSMDLNIGRDLTVEMTTPLALAPGDLFELPVKVFAAANADQAAGQGGKVTVRTEGPVRLTGANPAGTGLVHDVKLDINLKPGESVFNVIKAEARPFKDGDDQVGVAKVFAESTSGAGETFTQEFEVVVRPPFPRVSIAKSGYLDKKEATFDISDKDYLKGSVSAGFSVSATPAVEAAKAVQYLHSYPYGCLEQTTSRSWMFLAADELLETVEMGGYNQKYIEDGLTAAATRLSAMQTVNGGFGYWPSDYNVHSWGSMYAIHFLTEASKKVTLPDGLLARSQKWLKGFVAETHSDTQYNFSTKAYAVYILALSGEYNQAWVSSLKEQEDNMYPSGRIFLAGAQAIIEGNSKALEKLDKIEDDPDYWFEEYSTFESESRNRSLKLMIWNEVDPLNPKARKLAAQVAQDGAKGYWRNTQENGMALFALGGHMAKTGADKKFSVNLYDQGGKALMNVTEADRSKSIYISKKSELINQRLTLKLADGSAGLPYYSLTLWGIPTQAPEPVAQQMRFKRYWVLENGERIELSSQENMANPVKVKKGERVTVELRVTPAASINNMVIVDLLPGGFEIDNPRLEARDETEAEQTEGSDDGQSGSDLRVEAREDRMVFIDPWVYPRTYDGKPQDYVYSYSMRAVGAGSFMLPPSQVEGMYDPEQKAILATGQVEITPQETPNGQWEFTMGSMF